MAPPLLPLSSLAGKLTLSFTGTSVVSVVILDAAGRVVKRIGTNNTVTQRIAVADLAPGSYTVQALGHAPVRFVKR